MCFLCQLDKMKCHDKIKKLNGRRGEEREREEGWRRRHFKSDEMERDLSSVPPSEARWDEIMACSSVRETSTAE